MCGQHNVRASAEDNTGQNIDKGHAPNSRKEIKIPDPAGNRTRAAAPGWKGGTLPTTPRQRIPETSTEIFWMFYFKNLVRMESFEIYILKLI